MWRLCKYSNKQTFKSGICLLLIIFGIILGGIYDLSKTRTIENGQDNLQQRKLNAATDIENSVSLSNGEEFSTDILRLDLQSNYNVGGGYSLDIKVNESLVYVAHAYGGILVLNISDPANPTQVQVIKKTESIVNIHIINKYVLGFTYDYKTVEVYKLHNQELEFVNTQNLPFTTASIVLKDDRLYEFRPGILRIFNLADPENIALIDSLLFPALSFSSDIGFDVEGGILYFAASNTIHIHDISDLSQPASLGSFDIDPSLVPELIAEMKYYNKTLFVASRNEYLIILNVTQPSQVELESSIFYQWFQHQKEIQFFSKYMVNFSPRGYLSVYDINLISTPIKIYSESGTPQEIQIAINFPYIYTATTTLGIDTYYIDSSSNVNLVNNLKTDGQQADEIKFHKNYAIMNYGYGGIHFVDISNIDSPAFVTSVYPNFAVANDKYQDLFDIEIFNNYLFISSSNSIAVFDISNISDIVSINQITGYNPSGLVIWDNYLAFSDFDLTIVDIGNGSEFNVVFNDEYFTSYSPNDKLIVDEGILYRLGHASFHVFNVITPAFTSLLTTFDSGFSSEMDFVIHSDTLYFVSGTSLHVYDISNPADPVKIKEDTRWYSEIGIIQDLVICMDFYYKISIYQRTNSDDMSLVDEIDRISYLPNLIVLPSPQFVESFIINETRSLIVISAGLAGFYFFYYELDYDQDGLTMDEEEYYGTKDNNPDMDNDLLLDGQEVKLYKTDPLDNDSDDDGISDFVEVREGTDPLDRNDYPTISSDTTNTSTTSTTSTSSVSTQITSTRTTSQNTQQSSTSSSEPSTNAGLNFSLLSQLIVFSVILVRIRRHSLR